MSIETIQILFFCLVPIGIFVLVKSIKLMRRSFNGEIIVEIPYSTKSQQFSVSTAGTYSIWQKGPLFKKTPVNQFKPQIYNEKTGNIIPLNYSLMRPNSNNGSTGRMELFTFHAIPGNYTLTLIEGSSLSKLESMITEIIPLNSIDLSKYSIQIRKSQPFYYLLIGIILAAVSGFFIIGGFCFGILVDQIFK